MEVVDAIRTGHKAVTAAYAQIVVGENQPVQFSFMAGSYRAYLDTGWVGTMHAWTYQVVKSSRVFILVS